MGSTLTIDNPVKRAKQLERLMALGDYIAVLLTRRDLTDRIQHDYDHMHMLMNDMPGGFCRIKLIKDAPPIIVYLNDGFCSLIGKTRDEVLRDYGDNARGLVDEDELKRIKENAADKHFDGGQFSMEAKLKRGTGHIWVMVFGRFVKSAGGELILNAYFTDITEQREAQERLRVSEEENRLAIAHSGNIITKFDVKTRKLYLPASLNPIFELPPVLDNMPEEQIALNRVSPETADSYTELFMSIVNGSKSGSATFQHHSRSI